MMSHKRLGANSLGYKLPSSLYRHIYSFIKRKEKVSKIIFLAQRKFWIVDLGSVFGTYVKIKGKMNHALEKGQTYLVGADTYFNIINMNQPAQKV